jgi:NADPH:quinone reductase-like Zn-dependent oxidoreductase
VQIAKLYGADVTAVCSGANESLVKGLGADRVIDYHLQDFTRSGDRYDIIFDAVSSRSYGDCNRVLTARGVYINTLPSFSIFRDILLTSLFPGKKAATMMVGFKAEDMAWLCGQIEAGRVKVVLDKVFPMDQAKEALAYSQTGRARGKVVLKVL